MSTICVSDADLVARAREGDQGAFGELVDRHRGAVFRAAMAALRSHAEADEATQDAFVLAWRRLGSYRGESSFKTWLLSIAWHQAINRRRGLVRWLKRTAQIDDVEMESAKARLKGDTTVVASGFGRTTGGTPEQLLAGHELRRHIGEAIRALSPKLRDALLLAQSGEYSYEEIGAMLGVAVGTIKWRVSEARRLVKHGLRERGHAELG